MIWMAGGIIVLLLAVWGWAETKHLKTSRYVISDAGMPPGLDGLTIVQLSDLHQARFGRGQSRLLACCRMQKPDLIALTGDICDDENDEELLAFLRQLADIAPCYYVSGNHEAKMNDYTGWLQRVKDCGITDLNDRTCPYSYGDVKITLAGLSDPTHQVDRHDAASNRNWTSLRLDQLSADHDREYVILLTHRPELFDLYACYPVNLVLAGHSHGGQIRLPGIGALYAPQQGILPKWAGGMYHKKTATMVVSKGLGCSLLPIRLFNPAECMVAVLQKEKEN